MKKTKKNFADVGLPLQKTVNLRLYDDLKNEKKVNAQLVFIFSRLSKIFNKNLSMSTKNKTFTLQNLKWKYVVGTL